MLVCVSVFVCVCVCEREREREREKDSYLLAWIRPLDPGPGQMRVAQVVDAERERASERARDERERDEMRERCAWPRW